MENIRVAGMEKSTAASRPDHRLAVKEVCMQYDESQFIEWLNDAPVEHIFAMLEQECRRIENRWLRKGSSLDEGAASILIFRRFINTAMREVRLTHHVLPAGHITAYRKCIARLVTTGRLPSGAAEEFDRTFSGSKRLVECGLHERVRSR